MPFSLVCAVPALAVVLIVFLVAIRARGFRFALAAAVLSIAALLVLYYVAFTLITAGMG